MREGKSAAFVIKHEDLKERKKFRYCSFCQIVRRGEEFVMNKIKAILL